VVLVVAIDRAIAAWAAERIDFDQGMGSIQPLVLGPATVPVVVDPTVADREVELAVLSAMIHGNGSDGLAVVQATLGALGRLDQEHAAVYLKIIWDVLRAPMQRALEAMAMEGQTEGKATFPPFAQRIFEQGKLDGLREGKLDGLREALLRLLGRAGIALSADERARIESCAEPSTLDRWIENVIGAKTGSDVLT
jgi:hypothetical protein